MKKIFALSFMITIAQIMLAQKPSLPVYKVIKAGALIDVVSGKMLQNQIILIENNKIKEVGTQVQIPAGAEVIDLSKYTVLPGLMDCHTHITFQPRDYYGDLFRRTPMDNAVIAHVYAKRTLEAGFTTCRDLGADEFIDVALRNAINSGEVEGPRFLVATLAIGSTGSHADLSGFSPYVEFKTFSGVADGVDAVRSQVRFNIKYGADCIKFMATAGVLSEDETVGGTEYSLEEMKAIVEEAHLWGKKVAAHAHGTDGIKKAIIAGVNSIEHGSLLDDECIKLMIEKGTYLVPTIYALESIVADSTYKTWLPKLVNKARSISAQREAAFKKAFTSGIKIAYGTDAGVFPHGQNAKDFPFLVKYGLTPMQAIQAATVNAAALLGISDKAGSITAGKFADIVAVEGSPLENISLLEQIKFVMKEGIVYKQ